MILKDSTDATPPGVALVGCGYWGKNLARNLNALRALAGICDTDRERRSLLAREYPDTPLFGSHDELLADDRIRAIAIATPAATHARLTRESLLAGKDVFVEKPLALSAREAEQLVEVARARNRILMVGHLLWYHPAILKLRELTNRGELGRIQYIYSNRLNLGKIRREENILWSFAPHDVSVILGLLGELPTSVKAHGGSYLQEDVADVTVSCLAFPTGVRAHIFVSWLHPFKEQKLVVVGDRKMAVFDDLAESNKLLLFPHSIEWKNRYPVANRGQAETVPIDQVEPLKAECAHFLECVATRRRPRTDGDEAVRVLKVLENCQRALLENGEKRSQRELTSSPSYFAHESAFIDEDVEIGAGTRIWHVSHIMKGSRIGRNCNVGQNVVVGPNAFIGDNVKIQNNVSVYEGVTLEDNVFCGPSMVFTNVSRPRSEIPRKHELELTLVRNGATLGANSTIVCGVTIGRYAFVGAGAVVTKDVPDYALVTGSPARVRGWVCSCGHKLRVEGNDAECGCGRRYERYGSSLRPIGETVSIAGGQKEKGAIRVE